MLKVKFPNKICYAYPKILSHTILTERDKQKKAKLMHAVIFEVEIQEGAKDEYLEIAAKLREQLVTMPGFISIERFQSLVNDGKLLSLSFWEDEAALLNWKKNTDHLDAQSKGRKSIFKDYRIRIVKVERDYTLSSSNFSD